MEMSGEEFRAVRKDLKKTQAEIAEKLGCTRQHICDLEDRIIVPPYMALAIRQLERMHREAA